MAALTTKELKCLLDCLVVNSTRVLGVFPANFMPVQSTLGAKDSCFILNTDPGDAPGEHWLAFYYNSNTHKLEYFDSFGFPVAYYHHVNDALHANHLSSICVSVNSSGSLQSVQTAVCGHYCVMYLYWRAQHLNSSPRLFAHSVASSHTSPVQRDRLVVASLKNLSNRHPCCNALLGGLRTSADSEPYTSQSCCCSNAGRSCTHI